jgi:hypothetical protein
MTLKTFGSILFKPGELTKAICVIVIVLNLVSISFMTFKLSDISEECEFESRETRIWCSVFQTILCFICWKAIFPEKSPHLGITIQFNKDSQNENV